MSTPVGKRLKRWRISSKTIAVRLSSPGFLSSTKEEGESGELAGAGEATGFGEALGFGVVAGFGEVAGAGGVFCLGFSSLKRSRNWSSRNLGVRSFKSIRASELVSVRWLVS